jgi:hypothetical protein
MPDKRVFVQLVKFSFAAPGNFPLLVAQPLRYRTNIQNLQVFALPLKILFLYTLLHYYFLFITLPVTQRHSQVH